LLFKIIAVISNVTLILISEDVFTYVYAEETAERCCSAGIRFHYQTWELFVF